jgi:hypothetical protein
MEKSINCQIHFYTYGENVAGIHFQLTEELERKFREAAMRRFGYGKGALSRAAEEAIQEWLASTGDEEVKFKGDPVEAIDGLLADLNVDSVELQHLIKKVWISEALSSVSC